MDNPPGSLPAQRRTTLVAFLVLLISVMVITVLMVLPYVLAVTMGGILAVLAQPVLQWLTGHHVTPRVAAAVVVLGVGLVIMAPLAFFVTKAIQQGIAIGHGLAEGGVSLRSLLDHLSVSMGAHPLTWSRRERKETPPSARPCPMAMPC